ncbi:MAG: efflux RND transporter permease subunit [bacterium]|nr:efflux RND transporter permease subunit [bacterium]
MRWTGWPLDRPIATVMMLICITVLGAVAVFHLPLGLLPIVNEPEIDISVPFPGAHPLEALRQVVEPIEAEVASIPEVKHIYGFVGPDFAEVEVQFDWNADLDVKKSEVRDAVERARAELPAGVGHVRVEGDTDGPGAEVLNGRISARRDLSESWELLDRRIRQPLERIRGVARVQLYGVDPQEVRIDLDLAALKQHGIEVGELIERVESANLDMDLGTIHGGALRYDVRTSARFHEVEPLRRLPLGRDGLELADVADVALREPELTRGRHLNRDFAIGFDIFKEPTANTIETVDRLMQRIGEIENDPELEGITVLVWDNAGESIRMALYGLRNAGFFGGVLAVSVLFLFLRRIVTTAIVAVAIPFSLLVTCGAMFMLGMEFNVLTLLGLMLGVGMLVDNAVVVIENVFRLQGKGMSADAAARLGVRQVATAVVAATATTVIVWSWLFIIEPNEMKIYIGQVAAVICLAVVCSLVISLTFIPLAAVRFVPRRRVAGGFLLSWVVPRYREVLGWTLRHRFLTLLPLFLLAASAMVPIQLIDKSGEPETAQRDVQINYQIHDDTTRDVLEGYINIVEDWVESRAEELQYEQIYSWFQEPRGAITRVYLPQQRSSKADIKQLRERLRVGMPVMPGVELEIGDRRGRDRGPRSGVVVRVAVHGEDPEFLEELAYDAESRLRGLPDVIEVWGPSLVGRQEARVEIDPERARRLDVSPQSVADAVSFVFRGRHLRRFHGESGEVDLIVGLSEFERPGVASLDDLPVPSVDGRTVPLGSVAQIEHSRTRPNIRRVDRRTTAWITLEFDEENTTGIQAQELVETQMAGLDLPEGYSWDWGRRHHDDNEALGVMFRGLLLSLLVVVLLMAALFESFTQPLAILITLPLALFGAFWSLWLFGFDLEILGFIGIVILVGVVVNNGIVMVEHVNALRREGQARSDALVEGCGDRLRPVLMTAITTVCGLTPLAMSQFTVAGVYIQTLAVAMIGGLISSTVFTLVALPVWYTAVEDLGAVLAGLLPGRRMGRGLRLPRADVLVGGPQRN